MPLAISNKLLLDTNALYYSVGTDLIKNLRRISENLFWSEISLEELISGIGNQDEFNRRKSVFGKALELQRIIPDPIVFSPQQWDLKPARIHYDHSANLMKAVFEIVTSWSMAEVEALLNDSTLFCETKRKMFNEDFNAASRENIRSFKKEKKSRVTNRATLRNALLADQGVSKLLNRMKRTAYAVNAGLIETESFTEEGLRRLNEKEWLLDVPELTTAEFEEKKRAFEPYVNVYASYVSWRAFRTSPTKYKNDSNDLDVMKYLPLGYSIVTSDRDWIDICSEAGLSTAHVFDVSQDPEATVAIYLINA